MSKVSENIKKFRNEKGIKQSELGSLLGKAPSVIANWEAETNRPDVDSIAKMCEIFEIDANTFFGWENIKKPVTNDELSAVKNDFIAFISSLSDEQVEKVKALVQTALLLGEK